MRIALTSAPSHNLMCSIVTDDYGNQFQVLPATVCRLAHRSSCDFWYDGLTDPDYFEYVLGDAKC